jgi:hypothetical protein
MTSVAARQIAADVLICAARAALLRVDDPRMLFAGQAARARNLFGHLLVHLREAGFFGLDTKVKPFGIRHRNEVGTGTHDLLRHAAQTRADVEEHLSVLVDTSLNAINLHPLKSAADSAPLTSLLFWSC